MSIPRTAILAAIVAFLTGTLLFMSSTPSLGAAATCDNGKGDCVTGADGQPIQIQGNGTVGSGTPTRGTTAGGRTPRQTNPPIADGNPTPGGDAQAPSDGPPSDAGAFEHSDDVNPREVGEEGSVCDGNKDTPEDGATRTDSKAGPDGKTAKETKNDPTAKTVERQMRVRQGEQPSAKAQELQKQIQAAGAAGDAAKVKELNAELATELQRQTESGQHAAKAKEALEALKKEKPELLEALKKAGIKESELDHCALAMLAATKENNPAAYQKAIDGIKKAKEAKTAKEAKAMIQKLAKELEGGDAASRDAACAVHSLTGPVPEYCNQKKPKTQDTVKDLDANAPTSGKCPTGGKGDCVKITPYAYPKDAGAGANDRKGLGNASNQLEDGRSVALSRDLSKNGGFKPGDEVWLEGPNGERRYMGVFDDSTDAAQVNNIDVYDPRNTLGGDMGKRFLPPGWSVVRGPNVGVINHGDRTMTRRWR